MNVQEEQLHCCQFATLLTPGWGNSGDFDFLLCRARVDTLYFMSDMIPIKRTLPRDCVQLSLLFQAIAKTWSEIFEKGGKNENSRIAFPENVPILQDKMHCSKFNMDYSVRKYG